MTELPISLRKAKPFERVDRPSMTRAACRRAARVPPEVGNPARGAPCLRTGRPARRSRRAGGGAGQPARRPGWPPTRGNAAWAAATACRRQPQSLGDDPGDLLRGGILDLQAPPPPGPIGRRCRVLARAGCRSFHAPVTILVMMSSTTLALRPAEVTASCRVTTGAPFNLSTRCAALTRAPRGRRSMHDVDR